MNLRCKEGAQATQKGEINQGEVRQNASEALGKKKEKSKATRRSCRNSGRVSWSRGQKEEKGGEKSRPIHTARTLLRRKGEGSINMRHGRVRKEIDGQRGSEGSK